MRPPEASLIDTRPESHRGSHPGGPIDGRLAQCTVCCTACGQSETLDYGLVTPR